MIKRKINILMLGGAKRVAMAEQLIRAGKQLGVNVSIFSHELDAQEPIASVGKVIVGKRYADSAVDAELDGIVEKYGINIVLPFVDPAIEVAARLAERHSDVFVPVSSIELSRAMFDKVEAARLFEQASIAVPTTYQADAITFPAILKPRTGSASRGIVVANAPSDVESAPLPLDQYLIQQYIAERHEYTVDCYVGMIDNEVKCAVPRRRIATAGGEVIRTITCRNLELERAARHVLTSLHLRGAVTLQFIHDLTSNSFLLMEINPRLGGGVICSICAGADIASMIIEEAEDINALPRNHWRDQTLMTRYFKEVIFFNDSQPDDNE
ncbi:MAG: ATP-grasp domain-containing protein [Muribaculaceae bacterium]